MEGRLLSRGHQAGRDAGVLRRATADGRDQQHLLSHAEEGRARELGKPAPKDFRFAIKASRRITHMARLKADEAADPVAYLYKNLAALGAKRGPVLFQLPPFLKKDLPRLCGSLACCPRDTAPPSNSATRPGFPTMSTTRSRRPERRCACPSAKTTRRRRWWKRRPGVTSGCGSKLFGRLLKQWARRLAATPWREIYVYFMHEPTAPAYAQTLMRLFADRASHEGLHRHRSPCRSPLTNADASPACCKRRRSARLLRAGARRRCGDDAPVHGSRRGRSGGARHRHAALSVSVHGAWLEAAGCAQGRAAAVRAAVAEALPAAGRPASRAANPLAGA